ncbi:tetratricopeptide repeat protein [Actimicrobium antarcticum]|uniref:protein O-GlcNAc transferase n=1 Tax=Actimicrobium antarcticum TaxID=1051899 RepID=A0ABP7SRL8_9BURK
MSKSKIQRNASCPCGSGKKYKQCCALLTDTASAASSGPSTTLTAQFALALQAFNDGQLDASASLCHQILDVDPAHADALHLSGLINFSRGDLASCVSLIRAAIVQHPSEPRYFYNLGIALLKMGERIDAVAQFRTVIRLDPLHADAHGNLAVALHELGDLAPAIESHLNAIALKPGDAVALTNYGATLNVDGQFQEAIKVLVQALAIDPDHVEAFNNLGLASQRTGYEAQAELFFRRAIELAPDNATAHFNLADSMQKQSRLEEIISSCRAGLALRPNNDVAHSNLLLYLQYSTLHTPEQVFAEHLQFARQFEEPLMRDWADHPNSRDPERRLKIGYVSADFRNHAVAYFIEAILQNHDPEQVDVFCYHNHPEQDVVTERFMSIVPHWIPCFDMSDEQLAAKIRADGIDILVDLSGHTSGNRLLTFARKPAPIQITWIGCPSTTGLTAMNYRFTDNEMDPIGTTEIYHSEKLWRLPVSAQFSPAENRAPINELPALSSSDFVFACLNNIIKITPHAIRLWAMILQSVPHAKLMLGNSDNSQIQERLKIAFENEGINKERLIFLPRLSLSDYLQIHQEIDLALDTFPYNGGTTTLHSLSMGVPVVTLAGVMPVSRCGLTILNNIGLTDFIANSSDEYIKKAQYFSRNLIELDSIRQSLKKTYAPSSETRSDLLTRSVEAAYRSMWKNWCIEIK